MRTGQRNSKSIGNVVDPFDAMELWGVDVVRFYMVRVGGRFKDDVGMATRLFPRIFMNEPLLVYKTGLLKHADEIRSLLGNSFLRITSKTIKKHIASVPRLAFAQLLDQFLDGPNADVLSSLRALKGRVERCVEKFEMGEALDAIIPALKEVCTLVHSISNPPYELQRRTAR
jgi:methionyl-tRNA synthetase